MTAEKSTPKSGFLSRYPRPVVLAVAGIVALLVVAVVVALFVTSSPAFFNRYHVYQRSYATMQSSAHKNLRCDQCHGDAQGPVVYRFALVGDFYAGLFGKPTQPVFVKFATPTNEACLVCHRYDWSDDSSKTSKIPHPAHLRVAAETRDCVTCHRWIAHEETYQGQHTKMPFSVVCASFACHVGVKPASDCKNCHHQLQQSLGTWKATHPQVVRSYGPNACLEKCHTADQCRECHTTGKTPVLPGVINASTVTVIEQAHVKSDWLSQHGTFALQDQSKCMTCHLTLTECLDCHAKRPAFHGTNNTAWIGTHKNFAKDKRRCLTCHQQVWCDACHKQFKEMQ
jgi:hypothetical protein